MKCEYSEMGQCEGEVKVRKSMTAYHFEGVKNSPEDPNRDFHACDTCYSEHVAHWADMWNDYYSAVGGILIE